MKTALTTAAIALTMAIAAPAAADEAGAPVKAEATVSADVAAPPAATRPAPESMGTQRVIGATLGALGFLTTAVGGFFILSSLNTYTEAESDCKKRGCSTSDVQDSKDARSLANAGGIVLVSGIAVLGGGIALWLTAPSKKADEPAKSSLGIMPSLGGLSAVGTF